MPDHLDVPVTDASAPQATLGAEPIRIDSSAGVTRLAATVLDPGRSQPIVCLTSKSDPGADANELARHLAGVAAVWVLPTGDLSWELTDRLPEHLDVYGGAARIWLPLGAAVPRPEEHPLLLAHGRENEGTLGERILRQLHVLGYLGGELPVLGGGDPVAIVDRVSANGAELFLPGGVRAYAKRECVSQANLDPRYVLRPGQQVRVRLLGSPRPGHAFPVDLRPFEPLAWERAIAQYPPGSLIEAIVIENRPDGAFLRVFPGVDGWLPAHLLLPEWRHGNEEALQPNDCIPVRVESAVQRERTFQVSTIAVDEDELPLPIASLHPDGPGWLDVSEMFREPAPGEAAGRVESEASVELPGFADAEDAPMQLPAGIASAAAAVIYELTAAAAAADERLARAEDEAQRVMRDLDRHIVETRRRLVDMESGSASSELAKLETMLADTARDAEDLKARLGACESARKQMAGKQADDRARARENNKRIESQLDDVRERNVTLERILTGSGFDSQGLFLAEVRLSWEDKVAPQPADRDRYPLVEPVLGPNFLDSVVRLEGISRDKIVAVCAEVACGRAAEKAGRQLHELRKAESGASPQRVRESDGALAWRCSLQTKTPAARRLHYWRLPDGRIELARVVYHDNSSI